MLVIFGENKYSDFKKSHIKPSDYCKTILWFTNVKSPDSSFDEKQISSRRENYG